MRNPQSSSKWLALVVLVTAVCAVGVGIGWAGWFMGTKDRERAEEAAREVVVETCLGVDRYERVQRQASIVVFDTCLGRYYVWNDGEGWDILIDAIPSVPATVEEHAAWDALWEESYER